jgi:hypothetical protein
LLSETGNKIAMAQCGKADCHIDSVKVRDTLKAATSKGRQRCRNITMHGDLINIRNQCIFDCLDILYMFFAFFCIDGSNILLYNISVWSEKSR